MPTDIDDAYRRFKVNRQIVRVWGDSARTKIENMSSQYREYEDVTISLSKVIIWLDNWVPDLAKERFEIIYNTNLADGTLLEFFDDLDEMLNSYVDNAISAIDKCRRDVEIDRIHQLLTKNKLLKDKMTNASTIAMAIGLLISFWVFITITIALLDGNRGAVLKLATIEIAVIVIVVALNYIRSRVAAGKTPQMRRRMAHCDKLISIYKTLSANIGRPMLHNVDVR